MSKRLEERGPLVDGMMERCGADVAEGFRQGVMSPRLFRECLARCAECEDTEGCKRLLASEDGGTEPFEACRNKEEIDALKERLRRAKS